MLRNFISVINRKEDIQVNKRLKSNPEFILHKCCTDFKIMIVDVFSAVADVSSAYLSLEGRSEGCSNRLYSGSSTDPV